MRGLFNVRFRAKDTRREGRRTGACDTRRVEAGPEKRWSKAVPEAQADSWLCALLNAAGLNNPISAVQRETTIRFALPQARPKAASFGFGPPIGALGAGFIPKGKIILMALDAALGKKEKSRRPEARLSLC